MTIPYYQDDRVTLYLGDFREVLPGLGITADLIVADPPYAETSLRWDRWPDGWPTALIPYGRSMWCHGSFRMFMDRRDEFAGWKLSQDIVWQKHNGSGAAKDRFRRIHEIGAHWYRGDWATIHHDTPTVGPDRRPSRVTRGATPHLGKYGNAPTTIEGQRLMTTVIYAPSMHGNALNETQKPEGLLTPLIQYGCPPGGLVLAPFAGSGSDLVTARNLGMHAVGFEIRESQCEKAALRLSHMPLDLTAEGA